MNTPLRRLLIPAMLLANVALLNGASCSSDSAETISRNVDIIVDGVYRHPTAGSTLVSRTSGAPVEQFSVRQSGDRLDVVDNNGRLYKGSIGRVTEGGLASFTVEGQIAGGTSVTISGSFEVSGSSSTMRGTWIEPTLFADVFGQATVPVSDTPVDDGNGTGSVRVAPTSVNLSAGGGTTQFTASGGSGNFRWSLSNTSVGRITAISGTRDATVTYEATATGNNTITATDDDGTSASASITQQ